MIIDVESCYLESIPCEDCAKCVLFDGGGECEHPLEHCIDEFGRRSIFIHLTKNTAAKVFASVMDNKKKK